MQLISLMNQIFKRKNLKLWLKPYEIIATSHDTGLIEFIEDGLGVEGSHNVAVSLVDGHQEVREQTFVEAEFATFLHWILSHSQFDYY